PTAQKVSDPSFAVLAITHSSGVDMTPSEFPYVPKMFLYLLVKFHRNERNLKSIDAIDVRSVGGDSLRSPLQGGPNGFKPRTGLSNSIDLFIALALTNTWFTSTKVVPTKETTNKSVLTPTQGIIVYNRRPKAPKLVGSSSKSKITESRISNSSDPTQTEGSIVSDVASSSLNDCRFGNDHIAKIMGYGDYQIGNVIISRVYYVEELGYNLFSVGQFCDSNLEVAFRKHTYLIRDLKGVDLLKGSRGSNLYTLSMENLKPDLSYLHVFGALCYPTNDGEDLAMASEQFSSGPGPKLLTPGTISSGLVQNIPSSTPSYSHCSKLAISSSTPSLTTIDQDVPSTSTSQTNHETPTPVIPLGVEEADHDIEVAHMDNNPYVDFLIPKPSFKESSSRVVIPNNVHSVNQPPEHINKWTKDNPLDNSYKEALVESYWIEAMQEELNEFECLKVWELVPHPDRVMIITLK
ncbi:hypothetical protein Tco_0492619, partial [Tanacetum coccineum]